MVPQVPGALVGRPSWAAPPCPYPSHEGLPLLPSQSLSSTHDFFFLLQIKIPAFLEGSAIKRWAREAVLRPPADQLHTYSPMFAFPLCRSRSPADLATAATAYDWVKNHVFLRGAWPIKDNPIASVISFMYKYKGKEMTGKDFKTKVLTNNEYFITMMEAYFEVLPPAELPTADCFLTRRLAFPGAEQGQGRAGEEGRRGCAGQRGRQRGTFLYLAHLLCICVRLCHLFPPCC